MKIRTYYNENRSNWLRKCLSHIKKVLELAKVNTNFPSQ